MRRQGTALLALNFRGWIGGTFVNSYGNRSWSIGVQRNWFRKQLSEDWRATLAGSSI